MSDRVRLGIIGCGKHARKAHGAALAKLPDLFEVDFLFDTAPRAIEEFIDVLVGTGFHGLQVCSTADEVFNQPIDAVLIATPPDSHLIYIEKAVKAKKHIFCEKPLCNPDNIACWSMQSVLTEAKQLNLVFSSCHPRRFEPMYLFLRDHVSYWRNDFGQVLEFNFRFFYHEVVESAWRRHDDSLMIDHLNHEIDTANFVLGQSGFRMRKLSDRYDRYHVVGMRDDGAALNFSGYRTLKQHVYSHECEIVFERGNVIASSALEDGKIRGEISSVDFEFNERETVKVFTPSSYEDLFVPMMENFYKAIKGTASSYVTLDELYLNTTVGIVLKYFEEFRS